ncbi:BTB/POZ domain-containing protein 2-like isoform X1 [Paramacrobiotus metropolitanus]|uniref:BTB/POZ domain-containing protein 2-like isoform X1 n=1 Tax=Paramacrobiotus metropolitanus TaxID=2943436 RepID=UPI0024456B11|nr:BTB/POZ domain-containing protein 2-like isoform X1 [Paramacrobiotus metropolitanus]
MDGPDSPESYETTPENEVPSPKSQPSCSEEHHDEPVEDNWIKKATCVADRLAYAVETGVLADVVFLVGLTEESAEKIPAHRCILSFGSNVFKDLLTQSNNQQDIPLRVDDLDPQAFRNVLRYLYTDKVSVNGETVIGTMYAAKKYDLPLLQAECDAYLKNNVTAENCLRWLTQFQSYGDVDLAMTYAKDIDRYAAAVLRSPLFLDLEHDLLCMLLARDTLAAPEKISSLRWNAGDKSSVCARIWSSRARICGQYCKRQFTWCAIRCSRCRIWRWARQRPVGYPATRSTSSCSIISAIPVCRNALSPRLVLASVSRDGCDGSVVKRCLVVLFQPNRILSDSVFHATPVYNSWRSVTTVQEWIHLTTGR